VHHVGRDAGFAWNPVHSLAAVYKRHNNSPALSPAPFGPVNRCIVDGL
jgi:hypothetical protein